MLVAAALQKQVTRDFSPAWSLAATVSAFADPTKIPTGYWPVTIQDKLDDPDAAGYHTDENNQPYSLVEYDQDWSVTASHETLEMLGDPMGNTLVAATIPAADMPKIRGLSARVRILRELCDPCEMATYPVNGVTLSDFLMPSWYLPLGTTGRNFSFQNTIPHPLSISKGGYYSYLASNNHWYQVTWFEGNGPVVADLGLNSDRPKGISLREFIDMQAAIVKRGLMKNYLAGHGLPVFRVRGRG